MANFTRVSILIGKGALSFSTVEISLFQGNFMGYVAMGDFNNDGKPDLVGFNTNQDTVTVSILLNTTS